MLWIASAETQMCSVSTSTQFPISFDDIQAWPKVANPPESSDPSATFNAATQTMKDDKPRDAIVLFTQVKVLGGDGGVRANMHRTDSC